MSFADIYQISGSAMTAQTVRLNTVASNLANAESPATTEDGVYKARSPVFAAVYHNSLIGNHHHDIDGASVRVQDVLQSGGALRRYEPHHPLADKDGYVFYPDVNVVEQTADMMSASRDFETNVDVLNNVKSMQQSLLKLGENV
ncbi:flagellar basal body rod protein FlgC [Scandinavium sp. H11S7]|uniref:flagellar basal body rod protein FlgC n=1 Tax=Scandinavium hiltneri TaxID=2926519 RepID=UPI0021668625|nr:flagellar basal body rod protein FlgC [Scandinavium hiltneri]MCS2158065.1 flagellar basal body rod protein FlgC [Scandinavium hiltneri]